VAAAVRIRATRARAEIRGLLWAAAAVTSCALAGLARAEAPAAPPPPDGFYAMPSLYWKSGEHRVDLGLNVRAREEMWDAFNDHTTWYTGTRTRISLKYSYQEIFALYGQFQDVRLNGLDQRSSGAELTYFNSSDQSEDVGDDSIRQLYLQLSPVPGAVLRAGRQDIKLGQEVLYPEPNWRYLKMSRIGERLIGTVGWSHAERSNDGATASIDFGEGGGYNAYAFAARPTTGVFDIPSAYHRQKDVVYGGGAFTVKRNTWLEKTELGLFGIVYDDDRPTDKGGLPDSVLVYTVGGHLLGVYPAGPGQVDGLLWGAGQLGRYNGLDQRAGAFLVEGGYQLSEVFAKPWLRLGVNAATGDGDPTDSNHHTFFNLLPTNHIYYGFADQIALQNIVNWFVQLRLAPHPMFQLNAFVHRFSLWNGDDARYSGTGAFSRKSFGFVANPSRGYRTVGTEYDVVATIPVHRAVTLELGYSNLQAAKMLNDQNLNFAYASFELTY
jgi:hypothetical protein